ncbi:hypothetical protein NDU88_005821 [Pleurodeles waltl]|uniref:Uncharacterized protein n=1 Tax=Pleurodeles waltl TaxID=8319 RepID=A0AAV7SMV3_PLEWA|nr:hypothetical protein NDU88_005821 [Pleurodeles waltl]
MLHISRRNSRRDEELLHVEGQDGDGVECSCRLSETLASNTSFLVDDKAYATLEADRQVWWVVAQDHLLAWEREPENRDSFL